MRNLLPICILISILLTLSNCSTHNTRYFLCTYDTKVKCYKEGAYKGDPIFEIEPQSYVLMEDNGFYRARIIYDGKEGYAIYNTPKTRKKLSKKKLNQLKFDKTQGYYVDNSYIPPMHYDFLSTILTSQSTNSDNTGTVYSESSNIRSKGSSVKVSGYYRKDGTYVKPHTRSAPKRSSSYKSSGRRR